MKVSEILEALEFDTGRFPQKALEAAVAQREEITPHLLAILEEAVADIDYLLYEEAYMAHLYAFYLLAQFREERAYPLLVEFFSIPGEMTLEVTGDFVTEDLGKVLASVSGGDMGPMQSLIENPQVNEYVRSAAMTGMTCLVVEGVRTREEVIDYFRSLFEEKLERSPDFVWGYLIGHCLDLYADELMPHIRQAFADDLVDEFYVDLDWVEEFMARGESAVLRQLEKDRHVHFVNDVIAEMEWWACFKEPSSPSLPQGVRHPAALRKRSAETIRVPAAVGGSTSTAVANRVGRISVGKHSKPCKNIRTLRRYDDPQIAS